MKLDTATDNMIHELEMLTYAQSYFSDKASDLDLASSPGGEKMVKLWFIVAHELEKEIEIKFNKLCDYIHEIKLMEAEEAKNGLLTEHSSS